MLVIFDDLKVLEMEIEQVELDACNNNWKLEAREREARVFIHELDCAVV